MAYEESQLIHCPVCWEPHVSPGEHVQSWDKQCSTDPFYQPLSKPQWSHRIPFKCKFGCHFTFVIEQSDNGTVLYTTDYVMTWDTKEFTT